MQFFSHSCMAAERPSAIATVVRSVASKTPGCPRPSVFRPIRMFSISDADTERLGVSPHGVGCDFF
jgi:hypothetical protein